MRMTSNSRVLRIVPLLIAFCLVSFPVQAQYSGGSGTAEDPYQIATAEDLMVLGESPEDYDKHFMLTADIDLDPNLPERKVFDKAVIAPDMQPYTVRFQGNLFTGVFDGNWHTISHLAITGVCYLGLFGTLGDGAKVSNLGLEAVDVNGTGDYVGGLVGWNWGGSVTASHSTGTVCGEWYNVGGLAGDNDGSISASYSSGTVTGYENVGGLVGSGSNITNCYSTGAVTGETRVGGLVGRNGEDFWGGRGSVTDCYSTGAVSGTADHVGGLVGFNRGDVTNCYSTGAVTGNEKIGGLVGSCYVSWGLPGQTTSSFWDIETSGLTTSDGGIGKTTAEMQTASTFLEADWDLVNVWGIGENQTYPYLRKYSAADINEDETVDFGDLAILAENWLAEIAP